METATPTAVKSFDEILLLAQSRGKWVTPDRLLNIRDRANDVQAEGVLGVFVETGVAKGCSATVLAHLAVQQGRKCYLLDNFEGLPAPTKEDGPGRSHLKGHCKGDYEDVRKFIFESVPGAEQHVEFLVGDFKDTCPQLAEKLRAAGEQIALAHLDGDWYESTKASIGNLGSLLAQRSAVLIDDYNWGEGCKKAIDEWLRSNSPATAVHSCGQYQGWFRL